MPFRAIYFIVEVENIDELIDECINSCIEGKKYDYVPLKLMSKIVTVPRHFIDGSEVKMFNDEELEKLYNVLTDNGKIKIISCTL